MNTLLWCLVGLEFVAIVALFWLVRGSRTLADEIECVDDKINSTTNDLRMSLVADKLEVAKSYASIGFVKDIERRLTNLIERKTAERPEAKPGDDQLVHVVPCFGREHQTSLGCWCHPRHDSKEPKVIIHHPEQ